MQSLAVGPVDEQKKNRTTKHLMAYDSRLRTAAAATADSLTLRPWSQERPPSALASRSPEHRPSDPRFRRYQMGLPCHHGIEKIANG